MFEKEATSAQFAQKIAELKGMIESKHPQMGTLLDQVHAALKKQPECVTLLSEEDIGVIADGLKIQTGIEFSAALAKPSGTKSLKSKIQQLGADAF
jgi:hypothetical protein